MTNSESLGPPTIQETKDQALALAVCQRLCMVSRQRQCLSRAPCAPERMWGVIPRQGGDMGLGVKDHTAVCHAGVGVCGGGQSAGAVTPHRMRSKRRISVCHATDDVHSVQSFG